jgi:hypothetical protein
MKKIFFVLLSIVCFGNFAFANSWIDTLKQQVEYIDQKQNIYHAIPYLSNNWKTYYFFGDFYYRSVNDLQDLLQNYIKPWIVWNYLFAIQWEKIIAIDKTKKTDISQCKAINYNQIKYIQAYPWTIKINNFQEHIIWNKISSDFACFISSSTIYFSNNIKSALDLDYIYSNIPKIEQKIATIPLGNTTSQKIKNIYTFVMQNTSYDYDALAKINQESSSFLRSDYKPFRLESFFEGEKIVCDWYSTTTAFLNNISWIPSQLVFWNVQAIEENDLSNLWIWHSWVKVWNFHYDNTFDDYDDKLLYSYFQKDNICFWLDHYIPWWTKIATIEQRTLYIKNNFNHLVSKCPEIMRSSILKDQTIVDILKYSLENRNADINKKLICNFFDLCSIDIKSNTDIVNMLKKIQLTLYNKDNTVRSVIDLWKELINIKYSDNNQEETKSSEESSSTYILTNKEKFALQQAIKMIYKYYEDRYSLEVTKNKMLQLKLNIASMIKSTNNEKTISQLTYIYENI